MCTATSMNSQPVTTPESPNSSLHRAYEYAEKLNNSAVLCIELGKYNRAEVSLTKALRLSNAYNKKSIIDVCRCYHCTLDGCIHFTEDSNRALRAKAFAKSRGTQQASSVFDRRCNCQTSRHSSDFSHPESFIYKRAIRSTCLPISDGHIMGPALSLIITFNLGLAKHLRAIEGEQESVKPNTCRRALLERSLRLYQAVHDCLRSSSRASNERSHENFDNETMEDSATQFKLILCNNICHVHHCLNNPIRLSSDSKCTYHKYLERLLLALVSVVLRKAVRTSIESNCNDNNLRRFSIDHEGFWRTLLLLF